MSFSIRPQDPVAAQELGRACGIGPAAAQALLGRGLGDERAARAFLAPKLAELTRPDAMADRAAAVDRIARAVRAKERIVVFGDYDVDGTTSAAILSSVLEDVGANVFAMVARRFEGGYGFSDCALDRAIEAGASLVVTCDCGSSDHERLARAKARGIDVIVVDHHLVPTEVLPALAFLNPHRPDCSFPYKNLSSAGLAFVVAAGLRAALDAKLDLRPYLDLVALGTVADLVPLDGDNRRLVRAGLARMSQPDARPAIQVLRDAAKMRALDPVSSVDIAFRFGPRLNAAGRIDDPNLTLAFLRARNLEEARSLGARIELLNEERKRVEAAVTEQALAQVAQIYGDAPRTGVVVAARDWHRGVVGISAARIVDTYGVPAIVVSIDEHGAGHGSCRGPAGSRLYDALSHCRASLELFGGHQAAAGLVVREEKLEAFRAAFADVTSGRETESAAPCGVEVDVVVGGRGYAMPMLKDLLQLEPFGMGNAETIFAVENAQVIRSKLVKDEHFKLDVRVGPSVLTAFGYRMAPRAPDADASVTLIGNLRYDAWRGGDALELRIIDLT